MKADFQIMKTSGGLMILKNTVILLLPIRILRKIFDKFRTDFSVFDPGHKLLGPLPFCALKRTI